MIDKSVYDLDYIRNLQSEYNCDPSLIERALYAFGLLEALRKTGMPFCFKGGTSLMLLLETPLRLSTDIDILVEPGTDVDKYISKASMIFPFLNKTEDIRKGRNGIVKRHFKFTYYSPLRNTEFYILLDVVFAHLPYAKTIRKEIRNNLLRTEGDNLSVDIPSPECLLGDKLTAFAPHTTGILLGSGCELEIAKQLFDSAVLSGLLADYPLFSATYKTVVKEEAAYRGGTWSEADVLQDTVRACICIISRGTLFSDEYTEYLRGIKSLKNHVLLKNYNADVAVWHACLIMYLASCLLSGNTFVKIESPENYLFERLEGEQYKKLVYVRKMRPNAYAYLVEATRNLKGLLLL